MSGTPDSTLADPLQIIADLQRQLAEQKVALEQVPFLLMRRSGHRNLRKRYRYPFTNMIRPPRPGRKRVARCETRILHCGPPSKNPAG